VHCGGGRERVGRVVRRGRERGGRLWGFVGRRGRYRSGVSEGMEGSQMKCRNAGRESVIRDKDVNKMGGNEKQ
jgi:hypothetical protein